MGHLKFRVVFVLFNFHFIIDLPVGHIAQYFVNLLRRVGEERESVPTKRVF